MRIGWVSIVLTFVGASAAAEDTVVCKKGYSVNVGMRAFEVKGLCGEPEHRETVRVPIRARGADGTTYVRGYAQFEYWKYAREPGRPLTVLTFEQATLKHIDLIARR